MRGCGRARAAFREIARQIQGDEARKPVRDTPLVVITALAEGADRIGAEIALEMGLELVAVLPMPRDEYEKDFTDPASRDKFRALLNAAKRVIELPLVPGATPESIRGQGPGRDQQYDALAAFLAETSHVLIAFWDGTNTGLAGGTGMLIEYRRSGIAPAKGPRPIGPNPSRTGLAYRIVMPRRSAKSPPSEPAGELRLLKLGRDGIAEKKLAETTGADTEWFGRLIRYHRPTTMI